MYKSESSKSAEDIKQTCIENVRIEFSTWISLSDATVEIHHRTPKLVKGISRRGRENCENIDTQGISHLHWNHIKFSEGGIIFHFDHDVKKENLRYDGGRHYLVWRSIRAVMRSERAAYTEKNVSYPTPYCH